MMRKNIFNGRKEHKKFAWYTYQRLVSGEWFSLADIMADKMKLNSKSDLPYAISKCDGYGELKKAFGDVRKALLNRLNQDFVEEKREHGEKLFRYTNSEENNPLEDLINADTVIKLQDYAQFCLDSSGFFPISWLEDFFEGSVDILNIQKRKNRGTRNIVSSLDRELKNIEWLPYVYKMIRDKKVVYIQYQPYGKEIENIIFHPHLLKEFNGRWFLFGQEEGQPLGKIRNLALDRMVELPIEDEEGLKYFKPRDGFYSDYFQDIVGVSRNGREVSDVIIRAHYLQMFNLTATKKIHHSQMILTEFGEYNGKYYGDFKVHVEINNEFIGRILQMGPGLEVIAPKSARELFRKKINKMAKLYEE